MTTKIVDTLTTARSTLLHPYSLDETALQSVLSQLKAKHIDDGDLYFQTSISEGWYLEDGEVKSGSYSIEKGVGIRAVSGDKTGYAYSEEISLLSLKNAALAAKSIAHQHSGSSSIPALLNQQRIDFYESINPLEGLNKQQKSIY
jgi:TldD protein